MKEIKRSVEDFLHNEVKDFSIHVVKERAIPNVIDGLKPSQRKVLYTANSVAKNFIKTYALVGYTAAIGGYSKGDGSLPDVITKLTQNFVGSNNVPFMDGSGAFGSRFVRDPASPRYISSKISKNFDRLFKDFEILTYTKQDGKFFEPDFYLPVIPTILLNGISGIAVGFACEFQPYEEKDIKENIKRFLNGKKMKELKPFFKGFEGKIEKIDGKWTQTGLYNIQRKTLTITELPTNYTRESYNKHLISLSEKKKIRDFQDNSTNGKYTFVIQLNEVLDEEKMIKLFKLRTNLNENLNAISENNKLLTFESINDIIEYFIKYRLEVLQRRKEFMVKKFSDKKKFTLDKIEFIEDVIKKKIPDSIFKSRKNLKDYLKVKGYDDTLANMPFTQFNEESIHDLKNNVQEYVLEIDYYNRVSTSELYDKDLRELGG